MVVVVVVVVADKQSKAMSYLRPCLYRHKLKGWGAHAGWARQWADLGTL